MIDLSFHLISLFAINWIKPSLSEDKNCPAQMTVSLRMTLHPRHATFAINYKSQTLTQTKIHYSFAFSMNRTTAAC